MIDINIHWIYDLNLLLLFHLLKCKIMNSGKYLLLVFLTININVSALEIAHLSAIEVK